MWQKVMPIVQFRKVEGYKSLSGKISPDKTFILLGLRKPVEKVISFWAGTKDFHVYESLDFS